MYIYYLHYIYIYVYMCHYLLAILRTVYYEPTHQNNILWQAAYIRY